MTDHDPMCSEAVSLPYSGMAYHCNCDLIARVVERERSNMDAFEASVRADERERWASDTPITDFTRLAAQRNAELAHAEAVAARLVEVICEDASVIAAHESAAANLLTVWRNTRAERDAARAKAKRFSAEIDRMVGELSSIRMEHDADLRARVEDALAYAKGFEAVKRERDAARAEADYCTGCDSPLTRCLTHHAETGGKCCPDCKHPAEARGFAILRSERDAARAEVARLEARWLARTPSYAALRDRREVLADLRAKVEALRSVQSMYDGQAIAPDPATVRAVLALIEEAGRG